MSKSLIFPLALLIVFLGSSCVEKDTTPPYVISTFPINGSQDVNPATTEISVSFNEPMRDQNWSWVYENKDTFPTMTGQPHYTEKYTKNILPVKLEKNKEYTVWVNSTNYKNFKDQSGNIAAPFKFTFKTQE